MFAVCNSRIVGGGRMIAPYAMIDDGLLDVCVVEAMPTIEFLSLLSRISGGGHVEDERVAYFRASEGRRHQRLSAAHRAPKDGIFKRRCEEAT